jgi:hypothetical protein
MRLFVQQDISIDVSLSAGRRLMNVRMKSAAQTEGSSRPRCRKCDRNISNVTPHQQTQKTNATTATQHRTAADSIKYTCSVRISSRKCRSAIQRPTRGPFNYG